MASSSHFNKSITGVKTLVCKGLGAKESRPLYKALEILAHLLFFSLSFALLVIFKMDEHRHKVLVALVFFMAIRHVMAVVVILHQLALHQHYGAEKKDCRAKMRVLRHYNTCALPHTPLQAKKCAMSEVREIENDEKRRT